MARHDSQITDAPLGNQLAYGGPLWMRSHHEGLRDEHVRAVPRRDQLQRLPSVQRDRLLAEDVLAGVRGANGPRYVEMVGQGIVDRVHLRVCDELLVRAVRSRNAKSAGGCLGS